MTNESWWLKIFKVKKFAHLQGDFEGFKNVQLSHSHLDLLKMLSQSPFQNAS